MSEAKTKRVVTPSRVTAIQMWSRSNPPNAAPQHDGELNGCYIKSATTFRLVTYSLLMMPSSRNREHSSSRQYYPAALTIRVWNNLEFIIPNYG
jgi:hypothetical protein